MKKHLNTLLTVITFCIVFAAAQASYAQRTLPKDTKISNLANASQRAIIGSITADSSTNLTQLAEAYKCSDIVVELGEYKGSDFKVAQSGKAIGDIKDGKCAYFVPYDSKIPVKKYQMRFRTSNAFKMSFCSNYAYLSFPASPTVDYPKSDAGQPVKVDVTTSLKCKDIG